jgi:uncharacterized protein with NAD-binding domain and iron-sulfur cluster
MVKIVIVGGGLAGLSCATLLSDIRDNEICIYEKADKIGGQASSEYNNNCNIEHSWRIFGDTYHNLWFIINKILHMGDNFTSMKNVGLVYNNTVSDGNLTKWAIIPQILKTSKSENYYKYFDFLFLSRERVVNSYDHVNAYNYFDQNDIIKALIGPITGLEAVKLSISSVFNYIYQAIDQTKYTFSPEYTQVTKMPTSDAIFDPWEKYLCSKNVTIYKKHALQDVHIVNNKIQYILVKGEKIYADEFIFACSLKPLNKILEKKKKCKTFSNMKKMEQNLQLYFSINLYFKKTIDMSVDHFILVDEAWQMVIQRKKEWPQKLIQSCKFEKKQVKEIWNVGFLDYVKGKNNKILRECSLEEAVEEGLAQVKNNSYIMNVMKKNNVAFDEVFLGYDIWHDYVNNTTTFPLEAHAGVKLADFNPKFSPNAGTLKYIPETQPCDIPDNMHLAGYYVKSTYGGASMEASCETGLTAGRKVLQKYGMQNGNKLPIKHTNKALVSSVIQGPFLYLDEMLFRHDLPPITAYINSFYLFLGLLLVLIILVVFGFVKGWGYLKKYSPILKSKIK